MNKYRQTAADLDKPTAQREPLWERIAAYTMAILISTGIAAMGVQWALSQ